MSLASLLSIALGMLQTGAPPLAFVPPPDQRVQVVAFQPDQVVPLRIATGYAAVIELAEDERVENIVVGNSVAWQVTANRAGDRVIVKPLSASTPTNLIVFTTARRYVILLEAGEGGSRDAFVLRFTYPGQLAPKTNAAVQLAAEYRLRGDRALFPIAMSDDGRRTTVTWSGEAALPAIFAIDETGGEALVNARMVDGDYLIEGVARRYVLRRGKARATAIRRPVKAQP